jgi:hypothetical protein
MRELEFHVRGRADDGRSLNRHQNGFGKIRAIPLVLIVVCAGLIIRTSQHNAGAGHVALVHGTTVRADRILIMVDNSSSMGGTDAEVRFQLGRLLASGASISDEVNIPGFAISFIDTLSLLPSFTQKVAEDARIDTVYIISDFSAGDSNANDPAASAAFIETLRKRRLRLYWATVRDDPIPEYYQLARMTGGDVIPLK